MLGRGLSSLTLFSFRLHLSHQICTMTNPLDLLCCPDLPSLVHQAPKYSIWEKNNNNLTDIEYH